MAILPILRMGDQRLLETARPVRLPLDPKMRRLADSMVETMMDAGGAGLAAPQVGLAWRLIVFRVPAERIASADSGRARPARILCNPSFSPADRRRQAGIEGCLSMPGLRAIIRRWYRIDYRGHTPQGTAVCDQGDGFLARVIQHECDHLDGILLPQRLDHPSHLGYRREIEDVARSIGDPDLQLCSGGNIA